jgi:hypothetical protein
MMGMVVWGMISMPLDKSVSFFFAHAMPFITEWVFMSMKTIRYTSANCSVPAEKNPGKEQQSRRLPVVYYRHVENIRQQCVPKEHCHQAENRDCRYKNQRSKKTSKLVLHFSPPV